MDWPQALAFCNNEHGVFKCYKEQEEIKIAVGTTMVKL